MSLNDRHQPGWVRRLTRPESPANVRGLAVLCLAAGALSLYTAAFPISPGADAARHFVEGTLALAAGALYWALAPTFRAWMLHLALVTNLVAVSLTLAQATTPISAALVISILLWTCIYVGIVYEPATARLYAALLCLGSGAGLLSGPIPTAGSLWVAFGTTFLVTTEILSRMISRLRADALTDPLTGLLNRKGFLEASQRAISMCRRAGEPLTVAHIDLDYFKQVNDRQGHGQGDRLLRLCADAWRREIRAADILARIGGDEFVVVLPASDRAAADELLTRLEAGSPIPWSYGTAELEPDDDIEACVARADIELYAAKARRTHGKASQNPKQPRTLIALTTLEEAA